MCGSDAEGVALKSKNLKYIHTICFSKYVVQFGIDVLSLLLLTYCLKKEAAVFLRAGIIKMANSQAR